MAVMKGVSSLQPLLTETPIYKMEWKKNTWAKEMPMTEDMHNTKKRCGGSSKSREGSPNSSMKTKRNVDV